MEITITIPDEAIDRIADGIKSESRQIAMKQGKNITFKKEGIEFIQEVLQAKIDNLFLSTDPEFIEARKQARKIQEDAQKASIDKLQALKKK